MSQIPTLENTVRKILAHGVSINPGIVRELMQYAADLYDQQNLLNHDDFLIENLRLKLKALTLPKKILLYYELLKESRNISLTGEYREYFFNAAIYFRQNFIVLEKNDGESSALEIQSETQSPL